jgi:cytochrome c oxidase subunit 3
MAAEQKHPYHLVDPSPWPIVGSTGALALALGALVYMHPGLLGLKEPAWWFFLPGVLLVGYTMFMWWRDVVLEAEVQHHHTPIVQIGLRYGMILFIASEVMFFFAFFWAFFDNYLFATEPAQVGRVHANQGEWPPAHISVFDPWDLPFMNTLILLLSGVTVTWAHHALREGNRRDLVRGLACTVALGIAFTALQVIEYSGAPFSFKREILDPANWEGFKLVKGGAYPSSFFMATGFHGFHVIIGTIFLTVCLFRARAGHFKPNHHFGFEAAAWYWLFVDVVWLFLFTAIYLFGSAGAPIAHH